MYVKILLSTTAKKIKKSLGLEAAVELRDILNCLRELK